MFRKFRVTNMAQVRFRQVYPKLTNILVIKQDIFIGYTPLNGCNIPSGHVSIPNKVADETSGSLVSIRVLYVKHQ